MWTARKDIVDEEFMERIENLILYGGVGVGKTLLAAAVG
ncbi:ATP-binding protein [Terribacillus aidingensis]|nr:ATP-binding protein [Terribacillus aidingensis]